MSEEEEEEEVGDPSSERPSKLDTNNFSAEKIDILSCKKKVDCSKSSSNMSGCRA